jgi:proteic killer suppression protein
MIKSFKNKETEKLFQGRFSSKLPQAIQRSAAIKLEVINAATLLETLRVPSSNYLEELQGVRKGQHSIRINKSGEFVLYGKATTPLMLKSSITIREVRTT